MGTVTNIKPENEWLDAELWNDYLEFRKEMGRPLTGTGEKRALIKLKRLIDDGGDQTLIIERSIECNWLGLFMQKPDEPKASVKDENAILRRGKALGILPKTGESMIDYTQRVMRAQR